MLSLIGYSRQDLVQKEISNSEVCFINVLYDYILITHITCELKI